MVGNNMIIGDGDDDRINGGNNMVSNGDDMVSGVAATTCSTSNQTPSTASSTPIQHTMASSASPTLFPLQDLCTRALSFPSSINPSERALILARPDPATENSLYIAATSLPLSALVVKALATPHTLSPQEAQVLVRGPVERKPAEKAARMQAYSALTDEQRDLLDRASGVVTDREEKKARNVAYRVLQSATAEDKAHEKSISTAAASPPQRQAEAGPHPAQPPRHHRKPIVFPRERTDWITLVRERNYSSWGLPMLRTAYNDPVAWLTFKTRFSALASRELNRIAPPVIVNTFSIQYIDDEDALAGAEQAGLLAYHARLVREGKVEDGYKWGIFVSADEKVLEDCSEEEREWVVPVWEAGWRAGEVGEQGWKGALGVRAGLVFRILMPKVARGDERPLEGLAMMAKGR